MTNSFAAKQEKRRTEYFNCNMLSLTVESPKDYTLRASCKEITVLTGLPSRLKQETSPAETENSDYQFEIRYVILSVTGTVLLFVCLLGFLRRKALVPGCTLALL